eukprot:TRINITY_DN260_c0_g1_i5.p1 TRINITY_DN260_c0_g1~~TRINITY_DN260_c0_g1_i5.p1  ORF type:complete len:159 (+),score=49.90 TRINITY_DN260_c0_g1_i5:67-543(+)
MNRFFGLAFALIACLLVTGIDAGFRLRHRDPSKATKVVRPFIHSSLQTTVHHSCHEHLTTDVCVAKPECLWCGHNTNAIPAMCYSKQESERLPTTAFVCSNSGIQSPVDCSTLTAQSACDTTPNCVWCKSAAIPSRCYAQDQAKKLPPGVFVCDPIKA